MILKRLTFLQFFAKKKHGLTRTAFLSPIQMMTLVVFMEVMIIKFFAVVLKSYN